MLSGNHPVVKASEWKNPFCAFVQYFGRKPEGVWQSLHTATLAWLPFIQAEYCSFITWQFAQAAGKRFSAIVESLGDTPAQIVVERAMYWNAAGQVWAAGTNALATKVR